MQLCLPLAGKDVYTCSEEKTRIIPTKEVLFSPASNIDIGSAYLYIYKPRLFIVKVTKQSKPRIFHDPPLTTVAQAKRTETFRQQQQQERMDKA